MPLPLPPSFQHEASVRGPEEVIKDSYCPACSSQEDTLSDLAVKRYPWTLGLSLPTLAHSILLQASDTQAPKLLSSQQPTGKPMGMCRISFTLQLGLKL